MIRLRVKEVAQQKGLSQGKLQQRTGVDIKTIRKIYRDPLVIVTTETLSKLGWALGVDPRELIEEIGPPTSLPLGE